MRATRAPMVGGSSARSTAGRVQRAAIAKHVREGTTTCQMHEPGHTDLKQRAPRDLAILGLQCQGRASLQLLQAHTQTQTQTTAQPPPSPPPGASTSHTNV